MKTRLGGWMRRQPYPREVYVLALIAFLVMVGFGVLIPVLPVFARSFGIGNLETGAVVSAFALLRLITSPLAARLLHRFSERAVLTTGVLIVAASSAAAGLAQSYPQLLIMRGVGGIGSAMFSVAALTLLLRSVPVTLRARATGAMQGGFLLGGMAGPALGGLLAQISLTAPFFFYSATLTVAGIAGLLLIREPSYDTSTRSLSVVTLRTAIKDPRFQAACVTNLAQGWNSFGVRSSLVPLVIVESLRRSPAEAGIAFAVAAVAQTIALAPAGWLADTRGRRPAMIIGGVLCGSTIAAVPLMPNLVLLTLVLIGYGLGAALLGTAPAAAVGDVAGGRGGQPVAVFSMMGDLGAIIGPLLAGLLADAVSMPIAFAVGGGLAILAALVSLRMGPTARAPEKSGSSESGGAP